MRLLKVLFIAKWRFLKCLVFHVICCYISRLNRLARGADMIQASTYSGDLRQLSANIARARSALNFTDKLSAGDIMHEIATDSADYLVELCPRGNILAYVRFSTNRPKAVETYDSALQSVIRLELPREEQDKAVYLLELYAGRSRNFVAAMDRFFKNYTI